MPRAPKHLWKVLSATWLLLWCPRDLLEVYGKHARPGLNSKSSLFQSSSLAARPPALFEKFYYIPLSLVHVKVIFAWESIHQRKGMWVIISCYYMWQINLQRIGGRKPGFYCSCLKWNKLTQCPCADWVSLDWDPLMWCHLRYCGLNCNTFVVASCTYLLLSMSCCPGMFSSFRLNTVLLKPT